MELSPTTAAAQSASAKSAPNDTDSGALANGANDMAGDFETFLTLLTTQLRNQDPLKPMEFDGIRGPARQLLGGGAAGPRK